MSVNPIWVPLRANTFVQLSASLTHAPLRSSASARPDVSSSEASRIAPNAIILRKFISRFPPASSMPTQHQRLDRQQQGLDAQQQRVDEAGGVDDVERELPAARRVLG